MCDDESNGGLKQELFVVEAISYVPCCSIARHLGLVIQPPQLYYHRQHQNKLIPLAQLALAS